MGGGPFTGVGAGAMAGLGLVVAAGVDGYRSGYQGQG